MTMETAPNALITGAAHRIGAAIARTLAADGWTVGIHHRDSTEAAEALCDDIRSGGGNAYMIQADLSDDDAIESLFDRAVALGGSVHCLVNNASVFERDGAETLNRNSWDRHMNVNLWAPARLSQLVAAGLPTGEVGNIVNIADQRVENIPPDFLSYTISKAGLWTLTQSLALSLAPAIRVNAIGPGPTLPSPRQSVEQFERQASRMPLGHGATADEIAAGVRYILSSASMTGQLIALDGGQHLGWEFPDPDAPPVEE